MGLLAPLWKLKFHVAAFLLVSVLVTGFIAFDLRRAHRDNLAYWDHLLSNAADDRVAVITLWLSQRKSDMEMLAENPGAIQLLSGKKGEAGRPVVERDLERMTRFGRFSGGVVLDNECRPIAQAGVFDDFSAAFDETCKIVLQKPGFHVIASGLEKGEMRLNLAQPVRAAEKNGEPLGMAILVSDPWKAMSPVLRPGAGPARSSEFLLVWKRNKEVVTFAPYRKVRDEPALFHKPLDDAAFLSRVAQNGDTAFEEFVDFRNTRVFGVGRKIRASGDQLVLKVDREEALADFLERALWEVLVGFLTIGCFAFVIHANYRATTARRMKQKLSLLEAQEQAAASKALFSQLFENTGDMVLSCDLQGKVLSLNRAAERFSGYAAGEAVGKNITDVLTPENRESFQQAVGRLMSGGEPAPREIDIIVRDGRHLVVETVSHLVWEGERPALIQIIARDITDRKRADEALRLSELRYRTLVEQAPEAIVLFDLDSGRFMDCNENAVRLFGRSRREMLETGPVSVSPPYQPDGQSSELAAWEQLAKALQGEAPVFEWTHLHSSGKEIPCEVRLVRMPSEGRLIRGSITDITERKRNVQALRESEARFRLLSEASFEGIGFTENGRIIHSNSRLAEMLGWELDEFIGTPVADLVAPASMELVMAHLRTGSEDPYEHLARRKDGTIFPVEIQARTIPWRGRTVRVTCVRDITLRSKAEEARRRSEELFRAIVRDQTDMIVRWKPDGTRTFVNEAYCKMFGGTAESTIGTSVFSTISDGVRGRILKKISTLTPAQPIGTSIYYSDRADGVEAWHQWTDRGFFDSEGRLVEIQSVGRDITDQKEAEEARKRSEDLFRGIVRDQTDMISRWKPDGTRTFVNEAYCRMFGKTEEQLIGTSFFPLIDEHDREAVFRKFASLTPERRIATSIHRSLLPDGTIGWQEWTDRAFFDASGEITELQSVGRDITERVFAEQALQQSERRYRDFINHSREGVWRIELDEPIPVSLPIEEAIERFFKLGRMAELNEAMLQILGVENNDRIMGKSIGEIPFLSDDVRIDSVRRIGDAWWKNNTVEFETTDASGKRKTLLRTTVPIVEDGLLVRVWGISRDVTEIRRTEQSLKSSEESYRLLFERNEAGVIKTAPDGTILECNDALARIYGYESREEILAINARALYVENAEREDLLEQLAREKNVAGIELRAQRKDGTSGWVLESASLIEDEAGGPVILATVVDITRMKDLSERLRQAQKMEAVGKLAAGVAHDFNNMLQIINGYSELLLDQLPAPNPQRDDVQQIKDIVDRAASLTRQLLAFSRQQVLTPQLLDLNESIGNLNQMLTRLIGEDIHLAVIKGRTLHQIKADPGQIQQVIINLAINARDAMPRGGTLMIETDNVEVSDEFAKTHFPMTPGPYVRMIMSDSGFGMDEHTQSRIFEPFFTTKEKGKGTGLGLATAYGIIKQSGGFIWVNSKKGQGATFQIYLPPAEAPVSAEDALAPTAEPEAAKGSETVLLVEDESNVRTLVRRALETIGYTVLEASNGPDALEQFEQHHGPVHLLMTDVVLPGMSGRELAERLMPQAQKMKILYMSGYTSDTILRHGELSSGAVLLQKPFTRDVLASTVRDILDRV